MFILFALLESGIKQIFSGFCMVPVAPSFLIAVAKTSSKSEKIIVFLYYSAVPNQMDLGILTGGYTSQNKGFVLDLETAIVATPGFIPAPVGRSRAGGPPILGGPI